MITLSTDSYAAMLRVAQQQAIQTGVPLDKQRSVKIEISPPPATAEPSDGIASQNDATGRIVSVLV